MTSLSLPPVPLQLAIAVDRSNPWGELLALLLGPNGQTRSNKDLIFRQQRDSEAGEVSLLSTNILNFDLSNASEDVSSIVLATTLRPEGVRPIQASIGIRVGQKTTKTSIPLPPFADGAMTIGSIRRWDNGWRFDPHAGRIYDNLQQLAAEYGVSFTEREDAKPAIQGAIAMRRQRTMEIMERDEALGHSAAKALETLDRKGYSDLRARVMLGLDFSRSMNELYASGTVDNLVRQILGMAFQVDDDGEVDVVLFGQEAYEYGIVNESRYRTFTEQARRDQELENNTMYGKAMARIIDHYHHGQHADPVLALIITDGDTTDPEETERLLRESSSLPIFWQFLAIGKRAVDLGDGRWLPEGFAFLEHLDNLSGRVVDNAAFALIEDPSRLDEDHLYAMMLHDFWIWLDAAREAGILRR